MRLKRCPENPIVVPGIYDYRRVSVFNPGVIYNNDEFLMYERAAGGLRPFKTSIGLLKSKDGIHFETVSDKPVFSGEDLGFPEGSVEDARVVKIDNTFYMCYALQPYAFDCWPTGIAVPDYYPENYPSWSQNKTEPMITRSGIAVSQDGISFSQLCYTTPPEIDDRDNTLFPEKIDGKFALLRRPMQYVGEKHGANEPGIWISFSEDLQAWTKPDLLAVAEVPQWEGLKIGAAAAPLKTEQGWLLLYHGVDAKSVYRVGAMFLDPTNPQKIIARTKSPIMEPQEYYEKFGLIINNTIFPTACCIYKGELYIYYGCCDTCISLATIPIEELVQHILRNMYTP